MPGVSDAVRQLNDEGDRGWEAVTLTPLADGTILVFSNDADKWSEDSRFVKSARPDQQGKYEVRGLPPGLPAAGDASSVTSDTDPGSAVCPLKPSFRQKGSS